MQRTYISRSLAVAAAAWMLAAAVSPATAFWPEMWRDTGHAIEQGRQHNAMWPYPYVCPDRVRAHAPFDVMVNNGWRRQNLLGGHHFNEEATKLTRAGELKVRWILTQTPPAHRQIFVERGLEPTVTDTRIATAKEFAVASTFDGSEPIVKDTNVESSGRPAAMVDLERNLYMQNRFENVDFFLEDSSTTSSSN